MNTFDLLNFRRQIIENNIILSFEGNISQGILIALVDTLKKRLLENDISPPGTSQYIIRRVYAIFIELAQNVQNHSLEKALLEEQGTGDTGVGIIVIREDENSFKICSGNNLLNADAEKLEAYCLMLNSLDEDELKKTYKSKLRLARKENEKGAGIGMIEIIRKSGSPIEFTMKPIDEQTMFITLSVKMAKGE